MKGHLEMDGITKADITAVRKGLVTCGELMEMLRRGASCGVDCDDLKAEAEMMFEFLTKVNEVYGPAFPTKG